jgi:hypothetical protein
MSDKLRAAAQAVGDAKDILFLREMSVHDKVYLRLEDAINAIKAALAEPAIKDSLTVAEQEPVAWKDKTYGNLHHVDYGGSVPLYTAPPRREFVGLTDDEVNLIYAEPQTHVGQYAKAIEAKLKELNHG